MRNISAVQRPMPRTWTSRATSSSSVRVSASSSGTVPFATFVARSTIAACWDSGELRHELREVVAARPELVLAQILEWRRRDPFGGRKVIALGIDVEQAGHEMARRASLLDHTHRRAPVPGVVVFAQLLE